MEADIKQVALEKLLSLPSMASLLEYIRWLDLECASASPEALQKQILTRSIVAAGRVLVAKQAFPTSHPVVATIQAAERYCLEPTEERFDSYFKAATASYPFGAGEGCYAVSELGYAGCEAGSGCISGAGSLYQIAAFVGVEVAVQQIAQELIPWLRGEADLIALRS